MKRAQIDDQKAAAADKLSLSLHSTPCLSNYESPMCNLGEFTVKFASGKEIRQKCSTSIKEV